MIVMLPDLAVAATNGTQLIGIRPISRSMGGVGIAYPMDAISAVFSNPAAMCFGPYCPNSQVDFAVSFLAPNSSASVTGPGVGGTIKADPNNNVFMIPAIGLSIPLTQLTKTMPLWRFGLAAYGTSGLGADYRGTDLDQPNFFGPGIPLITGAYTNLQTVKTAPAIAFRPFDCLSFGLAFHLDYESLDQRYGSSYDYGFGAQIGGHLQSYR
jgi:long-chain fatty acid transport protein